MYVKMQVGSQVDGCRDSQINKRNKHNEAQHDEVMNNENVE